MEQPNWWLLLITAFIPLVIGSVWYNPRVFGNIWMKAAEITEERAKSGNILKIYGLTYLFSLLASYMLSGLSVHQFGVIQLFVGDPALAEAGTEVNNFVTEFMSTFGERHRSFGHCVVHGIEAALFMGFPFIGINSLFERRPTIYLWIHLGFWVLCFALMGGITCCWF